MWTLMNFCKKSYYLDLKYMLLYWLNDYEHNMIYLTWGQLVPTFQGEWD